MAEFNLDPQIGEEVFVQGHSGRFRITKVDACTDNPRLTRPYGSVDLEMLITGFQLEGIPWFALQFDEDRPVRRVIEWLKTNPYEATQFPKYILDYEVESKEDHEGSPAFYVTFLVEPGYFYENGKPSESRYAELNKFLHIVRSEILGLSLDRWPYVRIAEKRSLLDVAS